MEEFDPAGRRLNVIAPAETADWLRSQVRPNIAATLTVRQERQVGLTNHWLKGSPAEYDWAYDNLIHSLSRRYYRRAYFRYGKLIPNFATLEGNGDPKRFHIHSALRCPDHVAIPDFIQAIHLHWTSSPWRMGDNRIEPIADDWCGYVLKEGSEALLLSSISF